MDAQNLIPPIPTSTQLAEKLEDLLAELMARNPTDMRGTLVSDDARAIQRVEALNNYLLALRLTVVTGDRNAMFDRISAGIAECRVITNPTGTKSTP